MSARIGVVVVNWEQAERSATCLRSVLAGSGSDVLAILVDNGSRRSFDVSREQLSSVYLARLSENRGYAAACNFGARLAIEAGVSYLLLLNNDTTLAPGALDALLAAADRHPDSILAPMIVFSSDPGRVWSAGGTLHRPWMENSHLGQGDDVNRHATERRVDWATGCALFCSAKTFVNVGGLDEGFFLYLEDLDWCLQAARKGIDVWFEPAAVVTHDVSASTSALPAPEVVYYGCRNTYRVALRHNTGPRRILLALALVWTTGKAVLRNAISPNHRRDPTYQARTRALLDVVRGRTGPAPVIWSRRHSPEIAPVALDQ